MIPVKQTLWCTWWTDFLTDQEMFFQRPCFLNVFISRENQYSTIPVRDISAKWQNVCTFVVFHENATKQKSVLNCVSCVPNQVLFSIISHMHYLLVLLPHLHQYKVDGGLSLTVLELNLMCPYHPHPVRTQFSMGLHLLVVKCKVRAVISNSTTWSSRPIEFTVEIFSQCWKIKTVSKILHRKQRK